MARSALLLLPMVPLLLAADSPPPAGPQGHAQVWRSELTPEENHVLELGCEGELKANGETAYAECIRTGLARLTDSPRPVGLDELPSEVRKAVLEDCRGTRLFGLADYRDCLRGEVTAQSTRPAPVDWNDVPSEHRASLQARCGAPKGWKTWAEFDGCLHSHAQQLRAQDAASATSLPLWGWLVLAAGVYGVLRFALLLSPLPDARVAPSSSCVRCRERGQVANFLCTPCTEDIAKVVQASARRAAEEGPSQRQSGSERSHPTWEAWERQRRAHAEWEQQRQAAEKQAREREAAAAQERARRAAAQAREEEERRRQRASVRSLEELHQLSGSDFELLIARHFQRDGYTIERKGGSGDEGVDLIIRLNGTIDVVQCKRWRYDVGAPVVREFYGALMHHGARHGFVITTASITDSARAFAVGKPITLIDGVALLAWLQRGGQPGEARSERGAPSGSASRSPGDQGRAPFDPYRVLGIRRGASQGDIKRAYHTQLQQHHPDKAAHLGREAQALAEARTRDIIEAYRLLRRHAA